MNDIKEARVQSIEMMAFICGIVLQCFSVVSIGGSGISLLLCICIYIYIKYRLYNRINILFSMICILILIRMLSDCLYIGTPIFSIIRLFMIIFIMYVSFMYIITVYKQNKQKIFYKSYLYILFALNIYGIYSMFSKQFNLPLFMNIFINNPSYLVKETLFSYSSGWVENMRIYATFSEPSFYAFFLCINVVIVSNMDIKYSKKIYTYTLIIINLINTYSRGGYIVFTQLFLVMLIYRFVSKVIKNKRYAYKIISIIVILIPFINLYTMNFTNKYIFDDLSSDSRTKSSNYYLSNSFDDVGTLIIGHGYKSIALNHSEKLDKYNIESFAHNGYIEIIYEIGWVSFVLILVLVVKFINCNISSYEIRLQIMLLIATISSFVSFYNVESFISIISVIIGSGLMSKNKKFNENNI